MSSNPHKWQRKRAADSDDIQDGGDFADKSDDFKVKTLDEILQEKRRRTEEGQRSGRSSRTASPDVSSRRDLRLSLMAESPIEGEVIYQLSPEQISLSPSKYLSGEM